MEELIQVAFFVIIIIASMMDGVRRQRQRRTQAPPKREEREFDEYPVDEMPEYSGRYEDAEAISMPGRLDPPVDIDIDWDDGLSPSGGSGVEGGGDAGEEVTADTMVPADLWEEIRAMARGEASPAPEVPEPVPAPLPAPSIPPPAPRPGRVPDTSSWDAFEDGGADRSGSHRSMPSSVERAQRTSGVKAAIAAAAAAERDRPERLSPRARLEITHVEDLRRALVLKEILGTPRGLAPPEGLPKDQDG